MDLIIFMCGMSVGGAFVVSVLSMSTDPCAWCNRAPIGERRGAYDEPVYREKRLHAHEGIELGAETTAAHPCARGSDDPACQARRP